MNNTLDQRMEQYQQLSDMDIEQLYAEIQIVHNLRRENLNKIIEEKDAPLIKEYLCSNNYLLPNYAIRYLSDASTWFDYQKEDLDFVLALQPVQTWKDIFISDELTYLHRVLLSDKVSIEKLYNIMPISLKHIVESYNYIDSYTLESFEKLVSYDLIDFSCTHFLEKIKTGSNESIIIYILDNQYIINDVVSQNNLNKDSTNILSNEDISILYQEHILDYCPTTLCKLKELNDELNNISFDSLISNKLFGIATNLYNKDNDYVTYYTMFHYHILSLLNSADHNFSYILQNHPIDQKHVFSILKLCDQKYSDVKTKPALLLEHIKNYQPELFDGLEEIVHLAQLNHTDLKQLITQFQLEYKLDKEMIVQHDKLLNRKNKI